MLKSAASKVMWVGRATVFLVGLAVILALVFGVASTVSAHTGNKGFFHLGHRNISKAVSTLVKQGPGPALSLVVQSGQPPLNVNSTGRVPRLNADMVDGKHAGTFLPKGGKAADADKLDGLDANQLPGSIASIAQFAGPSGSIPGGATAYTFVGPTKTVTTSANQILVGAAQAPLALGTGGPQSFQYGLCYQTNSGGTINNFVGSNYSVGFLTTTRVSWAASASVTPGAGTWKVGYCVYNNGSGAINNPNYVNGWVQVINGGITVS